MEATTVDRSKLAVSTLLKAALATLLLAAVLADPVPVSDAPLAPTSVVAQR